MIEIYHPRPVSDLGLLDFDGLTLKVYGLLADGKEITEEMLKRAQIYARDDVLPIMAAQGDANGLGFVIIHPGDLGISISVHWWIQGSVLCQQIHRQLYGAEHPMDSVTRPVVACVWELSVINAEQEIWRRTMMTVNPRPAAYLEARATISAA